MAPCTTGQRLGERDISCALGDPAAARSTRSSKLASRRGGDSQFRLPQAHGPRTVEITTRVTVNYLVPDQSNNPNKQSRSLSVYIS